MTIVPAILLLAAGALSAAATSAMDSRAEAWEDFRSLYAAERFAEALPFAQRVVELTQASGDRDRELPTALGNLGATQLRLGDHAAAEASYQQALALLEATQGIASRRLITPLAGLGLVYAGMDRHDQAVEYLSRALAVSRRAEGLFNLTQLPLIEPLVESHLALGNLEPAARERLYALRVVEQNYGFDDPRTLPQLIRLARFYESLGQFAAARGLYLRMRDVSLKEGGALNPTTIRALIAIGRTHRLQYTIDPDSLIEAAAERDPFSGAPRPQSMASSSGNLRPDRAGQQALEQALQALRSASDPPRDLLAETLIELGDWMVTLRRPEVALPYYVEAATLHPAGADVAQPGPLTAPRQVFYRPPPASLRSRITTPGTILARRAEFSFTVATDGTTRDITVVSSEMGEGQRAQMQRALERALYSPRLEGGTPQVTEGVHFTATWYELEQPATDSVAQP